MVHRDIVWCLLITDGIWSLGLLGCGFLGTVSTLISSYTENDKQQL